MQCIGRFRNDIVWSITTEKVKYKEREVEYIKKERNEGKKKYKFDCIGAVSMIFTITRSTASFSADQNYILTDGRIFKRYSTITPTPLSRVEEKYTLPLPFGFKDISRRFLRGGIPRDFILHSTIPGGVWSRYYINIFRIYLT